MPGERIEPGVVEQCLRRQIEQPARHDRSASPHLGDRTEVDVVAVVSGVVEWRSLRVVGSVFGADVGVFGDLFDTVLFDGINDNVVASPGMFFDTVSGPLKGLQVKILSDAQQRRQRSIERRRRVGAIRKPYGV